MSCYTYYLQFGPFIKNISHSWSFYQEHFSFNSGVEFRYTQGESKKILLKHFARILRVIMCRAILLKKCIIIRLFI